MNALKTTFLYHAILLTLLIILLIITLSDRYPMMRIGQAMASASVPTATPMQVAMAQTQFNVPTGSTQAVDGQLQVEIRAEVVANGNARAQANASGPGDTVAKADTDGPGNAQAKSIALLPKDTVSAFITNPTPVYPTPVVLPTAAAPVVVPTGNGANAVVNGSQINLRSGPGLNYSILGAGNGGERYTVVGKSPDLQWYQVCCYSQQTVWAAAALINLYGSLDQIPIVGASMPIAPTALPVLPTPSPTVATQPAAPPLVPTPSYEFRLTEQTQFEERIMPRIYLFVTSGIDGLSGYGLRVRKDGMELATPLYSFGGQPQITWGQQSARQRYYNLKLEFPSISPAGVWEIQLLNASGREVGPPVQFRLNVNEANQEMYVRYDKIN
ncbi:MAG: hypothetical protein U0175_04380 [Caldilineaceae bacterium]